MAQYETTQSNNKSTEKVHDTYEKAQYLQKLLMNVMLKSPIRNSWINITNKIEFICWTIVKHLLKNSPKSSISFH